MHIRVNLTLWSVYFPYRGPHDRDTWVSLFHRHYNMLTQHWLDLRLLTWQEELFPTLLVVQGGQILMCPWIIETSGVYGLSLPSVGGDTHRDNSVKNNLLIEYWFTIISLLCVVELFALINR